MQILTTEKPLSTSAMPTRGQPPRYTCSTVISCLIPETRLVRPICTAKGWTSPRPAATSNTASRQQTEAENMLMAKELERQKANERFLKLLFILIIVIILAGFVLMMFQRQRKMYRELVKKHQEYLSKLDRKSSAGTDKDNSRRELFDRIEDLMRNGKIYRRNNISREMLAEQLDTNQNYISKAINTYAGMSFNRYVDSFRIEEATRQISQSPDNILFKQLADDLGYNSVTVFSKAFLREIGCSPSIYRKEILNSK